MWFVLQAITYGEINRTVDGLDYPKPLFYAHERTRSPHPEWKPRLPTQAMRIVVVCT